MVEAMSDADMRYSSSSFVTIIKQMRMISICNRQGEDNSNDKNDNENNTRLILRKLKFKALKQNPYGIHQKVRNRS